MLVINLLFTNFTSAANICATSGEPNSCESDNIPNDFLNDLGSLSSKNLTGLVVLYGPVIIVVGFIPKPFAIKPSESFIINLIVSNGFLNIFRTPIKLDLTKASTISLRG